MLGVHEKNDQIVALLRMSRLPVGQSSDLETVHGAFLDSTRQQFDTFELRARTPARSTTSTDGR